MPGETKQGLEILELVDQRAWGDWLQESGNRDAGVWLKFAKKASGRKTVTYAQAVQVALCYGWIDGQVSRYDERYYLQRFTPWRPRSKWSQINREKAEELIAAGEMKPAGLAQVQAAKQDGRWDQAYEPPSRATVPADFQEALDRNPEAKTFFETLTRANRYAFLYRIQDAGRAETRAKRIAHFVSMLAEGRALH